MRLALPSLFLFVYIFASLILFLPCRPWTKVAAGAALAAAGMKYLVYEKLGGSFFAPALPRPLLLTMEALYASLVILFFLLLLKDGLALLLWLSRCLGTSWRLPGAPPVRSLILAATALALGAWGTWQAVRVPAVHTLEIRLPNLPAVLDGFSIVQISDIHIGPLLKRDWLQQVVDRANALKPDLVALTGDMVDGAADRLQTEIAPLGDLRARYGVYGITGNHEYYFHAGEWLPVFEKLGILMLCNDHRILSVNGTDLVIAGLNDQVATRFGAPGPDIRKALSGTPDGPVRVLLAHRPRVPSGDQKVDLQLSGHTHGGHLFFMKWLIASFNGGLVGGLYEVNGTRLYVSPGTGLWSGFSCRLGVPSEISRIVLRASG
jgi:predicted MPP superfamily phosphohydrolase